MWQPQQEHKRCPHCYQELPLRYHPHPFSVPGSYGRGVWLVPDCRCIRKTRDMRRKGLDSVTRPALNHPLPPALRECDFVGFRTGSHNRAALDYCVKFAKRFSKVKDGKGLLLYGRSGVGKTHLACAIVNSLYETYWTSFAHVPTLLESIRRYQGELDKLMKTDLLVLDDLGSERGTDWTLERLLIIVESRLNFRKPTVFTTNYPLEDLELRLGMRLASRIIGNNLRVLVQGIDYRLQQSGFGTKRG